MKNASNTGRKDAVSDADRRVIWPENAQAVDLQIRRPPPRQLSNAPTARATTVVPKLTRAQQIAAIEEEMSDEERSAYLDAREMDQDFYNVEQGRPPAQRNLAR